MRILSITFFLAFAGSVCIAVSDGDFITFGGMDANEETTNTVGVVSLTSKSKQSCNGPALPVPLKEAQVFEFDNTLLLCTSFTKLKKKELQCYKWSPTSDGGKWLTFSTPTWNRARMAPFINAVKVPNVGIWFMGSTARDTLMLSKNAKSKKWEWKNGPTWINTRTRACSVLISDTKVARIGGQRVRRIYNNKNKKVVGNTIDVMDFSDPTTPPKQLEDVARMGWERKHLSCALIPKGESGHPTVAILGDNSKPYPFEMELWDTITNKITKVPHPTGYENYRFFRPVMTTYDDNSIILAGSKIFDDEGINYMSEIFQYKFGTGWVNLGTISPLLEAKEQFGIYIVKDDPRMKAALDSLKCSSE